MAVQLQGQNGTPIYGDAGSNAERVVLYDSSGNPISQLPNAVIGSTQKVLPVGGSSEGNYNDLRLDRMGNIRAGFDNLWLRDGVDGTSLNTSAWSTFTSVMTYGQSATTGIFFNSTAVASPGGYVNIISNKQFPLFPQAPLRARFRARAVPVATAVIEMGFGSPSFSTAQITNGACWRFTASGTCVPVVQYAGSDVTQGTDISGLLSSSNYYTFEVVVTDQEAIFTVYSQGLIISSQTLTVPASQARTWGVSHIPAFARLYTGATTPTSAAALYVSEIMVESFDLATNRPWNHTLAGTGLGGEVNPTTFAQTANMVNSAAPSNATLSNTAAGYTNLGGLFSFAAIAGAAIDFNLFSFTVPAPYSFLLTGVHITAYNTGAAVATTPTLLHWAAYSQASSANLSSATINRILLGSQYFPIGAAVGQCADKDIEVPFETPLRTDASKFVGVILRMPVGTATASQVIQGSVTLRGYFE